MQSLVQVNFIYRGSEDTGRQQSRTRRKRCQNVSHDSPVRGGSRLSSSRMFPSPSRTSSLVPVSITVGHTKESLAWPTTVSSDIGMITRCKRCQNLGHNSPVRGASWLSSWRMVPSPSPSTTSLLVPAFITVGHARIPREHSTCPACMQVAQHVGEPNLNQ